MGNHQTPNSFDKKTNLSLKSIIGDYQIEKVASGFQFTEGPVWIPDGFLLFSDIPANKIYKWEPGSESEVFEFLVLKRMVLRLLLLSSIRVSVLIVQMILL
jgi:hypothetical protein